MRRPPDEYWMAPRHEGIKMPNVDGWIWGGPQGRRRREMVPPLVRGFKVDRMTCACRCPNCSASVLVVNPLLMSTSSTQGVRFEVGCPECGIKGQGVGLVGYGGVRTPQVEDVEERDEA